MEHGKYCPFCCKVIYPYEDENGEVLGSAYTGFVYVHDDVPHDPDYRFEAQH